MDVGIHGTTWGFIAPLLVLQLILMAVALIMCFKAEQTNGPKWMWALIIIFGTMLGSVAFFVAGRRDV
jgi:hypothetical protein